MLYIVCNNDYNGLIGRAKIVNMIDINGEDGDENCSKIVKKILEIIGKDSPQAERHRLANIMREMINCTGLDNETTQEFIKRFNDFVVQYVYIVRSLNDRPA